MHERGRKFDFKNGLKFLQPEVAEPGHFQKQLSKIIEVYQGARKFHRFQDPELVHVLNENLALVKPGSLENQGVGQYFLILWNNTFNAMGGNAVKPVQVCLARGTNIGENDEKFKLLEVDYLGVGEISFEGRKFTPSTSKKVFRDRIYMNSTVIVDPNKEY